MSSYVIRWNNLSRCQPANHCGDPKRDSQWTASHHCACHIVITDVRSLVILHWSVRYFTPTVRIFLVFICLNANIRYFLVRFSFTYQIIWLSCFGRSDYTSSPILMYFKVSPVWKCCLISVICSFLLNVFCKEYKHTVRLTRTLETRSLPKRTFNSNMIYLK